MFPAAAAIQRSFVSSFSLSLSSVYFPLSLTYGGGGGGYRCHKRTYVRASERTAGKVEAAVQARSVGRYCWRRLWRLRRTRACPSLPATLPRLSSKTNERSLSNSLTQSVSALQSLHCLLTTELCAPPTPRALLFFFFFPSLSLLLLLFLPSLSHFSCSLSRQLVTEPLPTVAAAQAKGSATATTAALSGLRSTFGLGQQQFPPLGKHRRTLIPWRLKTLTTTKRQ